MPTYEISTPIQNQRRNFSFSSVALRVLFALIVSWLIVLAFFVSSVVSH